MWHNSGYMSNHHTPYGKIKLYRPQIEPAQEQIIVIPGYSESIAHNKKLVNALCARGFNAFCYSQPRSRGNTGLTDPIDRQGDVVLKILDLATKNNEKVHAVAHSLGCAAVVYAARQVPDRFASITLMQPLGMVGDQSFGELLNRVSKKVSRNTFGAMRGRHLTYDLQDEISTPLDKETRLRFSMRVARSQLAGAGILAKHPRLSVQEAKASGKYDITEGIKEVVKVGVPVHIVTAHGDEMFDRHKVEAGYEIISDHVSSYNALSGLSATHDTFWLHPERSAFLLNKIIQQSEV